MKRICAWCRKPLEEHNPTSDDQADITHGLCHDCAHHLLAETGMPLTEYLDGIKAPVLAIDDCLVVQTANRRACALLHRDLESVEGRKNGEVFECAHARLPSGCGHTLHCSGCVIRRTILETHETGECHSHVPACLRREAADKTETVELLISTEKVDHVVLLHIDAVNGFQFWQ